MNLWCGRLLRRAFLRGGLRGLRGRLLRRRAGLLRGLRGHVAGDRAPQRKLALEPQELLLNSVFHFNKQKEECNKLTYQNVDFITLDYTSMFYFIT